MSLLEKVYMVVQFGLVFAGLMAFIWLGYSLTLDPDRIYRFSERFLKFIDRIGEKIIKK